MLGLEHGLHLPDTILFFIVLGLQFHNAVMQGFYFIAVFLEHAIFARVLGVADCGIGVAVKIGGACGMAVHLLANLDAAGN